MILAICWLGLVGPFPPTRAESTPARVEVRLAAGPYLVGQAIAVDVVANPAAPDATREPIRPPVIPQADLIAVDREPAGPSDPGDRRRYYLVPRRAGGLTIPPFRTARGDRVVASRPTTITVANVPAGGRPPSFLGGVGEFRVAAAVEPAAVRVGQPVELRITLTGPAAAGSGQVPDLAGWAHFPPAFEVRGATSRLDRGDPPTRTFQYRLRPTKPGRATLPPVPLAAFDPRAGRYATRYTPSLVIEVAETPRFDPDQMDYQPAPRPGMRPRAPLILGGTLVGGGAVGVAWFIINRRIARRRTGRRVDWRREAARLRGLATDEDEQGQLAGQVAGRFADVLARELGRPLSC